MYIERKWKWTRMRTFPFLPPISECEEDIGIILCPVHLAISIAFAFSFIQRKLALSQRSLWMLMVAYTFIGWISCQLRRGLIFRVLVLKFTQWKYTYLFVMRELFRLVSMILKATRTWYFAHLENWGCVWTGPKRTDAIVYSSFSVAYIRFCTQGLPSVFFLSHNVKSDN